MEYYLGLVAKFELNEVFLDLIAAAASPRPRRVLVGEILQCEFANQGGVPEGGRGKRGGGMQQALGNRAKYSGTLG